MTHSISSSKPSFIWRNAWRMLVRDWRAGELNILALGLLIAVTSITAVGFFTDRVERGMNQQAAELIGADLAISSARDDLNVYTDEATRLGFKTAFTVSFRSVILGPQTPQLVEVKAVSDLYPLRGQLRIADDAYQPDHASQEIPQRGNIWIEPSLLQQLNISVGDTVSLGEKSFVAQHVIRYEPDRGGDLFSVAPRVMMNQADLAATQLLQQGALVNYRLLVSGPQNAIEKFRHQLESDLPPGQQLLTAKNGRPELQTALNSAQRFLALAAIISALLAGVAIATVAYRFSQRHLDTSAMLRCFGASQSTIVRLFSAEMLMLAVITSSIGCLLGYIIQFFISQILDQLLLTSLPAASFKPVIAAYASGIIMLLGFALPPLLVLGNVPPLHVLRRQIVLKSSRHWYLYVSVVVAISALLQWQLNELRLVAIVIAGIFFTTGLLAIIGYLMMAVLSRLQQHINIRWRLGLTNITRRRNSSVIQIVVFGLGIMILLLLSTIRTDLLGDWKNSLPADAPNYFIINIQSDQLTGVKNFFSMQHVETVKLYPMVRARLVAINNIPTRTENYENERARHLLTREFNLSWADQPQIDNTIVAGAWWQKSDTGKHLLSLEEGLAKTLQIALGDTVSFDINGKNNNFTVTNLRKVNWDSFNINFFTVIPSGVLESSPTSWVTSVYLDTKQASALSSLVKQFPNVTVVDISAIMQRVRSLMDRVILAVEFIFMFTLLAGLAVLYASIQANQDQRRYESAVCRTLGASKTVLLRALVLEFATLGGLAGLLAGCSATTIAYTLAKYIFNFAYQFDIAIVFYGIAAGVIIVGGAGIIGTYSVLQTPPINSLRQA